MADRSCCVNCHHFNFWPGDPGYSEFTPGSDMTISCAVGVWRADCDTFEAEFRRLMRSSETCEKFLAEVPK